MSFSDEGKEEAAALVLRIKEAFSYEGIVPPGGRDHFSRDLDTLEGSDNPFTGRRWQEVPAARVFYWYEGALTLMSNLAYRYYLPAFLVWSLEYSEIEHNLFDCILHHLRSFVHVIDPAEYLSNTSPGQLRDFPMANNLTEEQVSVICAYLRFLSRECYQEAAWEVYERHWKAEYEKILARSRKKQ